MASTVIAPARSPAAAFIDSARCACRHLRLPAHIIRVPVVTGASAIELLLPLHVADAQLLPLCSLVLWVLLLLLLLSLQLPCRLLRLPAPSPSQRTPKARIALPVAPCSQH